MTISIGSRGDLVVGVITPAFNISICIKTTLKSCPASTLLKIPEGAFVSPFWLNPQQYNLTVVLNGTGMIFLYVECNVHTIIPTC